VVGFLLGCSPNKNERVAIPQLDVLPKFKEWEYFEVNPGLQLNRIHPDIDEARALYFLDQKYPLLAPRMLFLDHEWKDASSLPDINKEDSVGQ
jgi:hypothetical protein